MVLDGLVWKTSPGAWEVEPPASSSGPCSTTVMLFQPRLASSSARLVPTMPAPMMTTRGDALISGSPGWLLRTLASAEYDGAGVVEQDAVLAVPLHGPGQRL